MMQLLGYVFSLLIGLALGLVGGGGTLLSIPILKYFFEIHDNQLLTSYSLFIVGITSLFGVANHLRSGNIRISVAMSFAVPSVFSLLIVRYFLLPVMPTVLLSIGHFVLTKDLFFICLFALLMIVVSGSMLRRKQSTHTPSVQHADIKKMILMGVIVGFMTGFMGAGGGFIIIPALYFFAGIDMKEALGTSLLIIAINTSIGFAGDVMRGVVFDYGLLLRITALAVVGMWAGILLSKKIKSEKLKPIFGWFVLLMGIYILIKEMFK